jgi:heme exporter protein C
MSGVRPRLFLQWHMACCVPRDMKPLLISIALIAAGLALGMASVPAEATQGASFRIAMLHYPAAAVSVALYALMAFLSAARLAHNMKAAGLVAQAIAPTGALFTLVALATEALWHKPVAGQWWIWDAQAVTQLMLLFLFGGVIAVRAMIDEPRRAERAAALLALIGAGNLPVLYFSIRWWDALQQGVRAFHVPPMPPSLAIASVLVGVGFASYALFAVLRRARCADAERQALAHSLHELQENRP